MQSLWSAGTHDDRPFYAAAGGLILLAWVSLAVWGVSPYDRYLHHDALASFQLSEAHLASLFIGGWTLMVIAMMLPTSLPLINVFRNIVRARSDRNLLVVLVISGYLLVWALFGVAVHVADLGLHQISHGLPLLHSNPWIFATTVFGVAGAYQFTELKYRCLDKCRSPMSFVMSYWRGRSERRNSLALGIHHGIFCVGCCWSLMLLMFAVGHANLAWMFLLGVIMGAEKNLRWGRALARPLGFGLLIGAVLIAGVGILH